MPTVDEVADAIRELSVSDRARLAEFIEELDADDRDRQIEADLLAGKFDGIADEASKAVAEG